MTMISNESKIKKDITKQKNTKTKRSQESFGRHRENVINIFTGL